MPDAHDLLVFIGAGILLNLTPGVDMLYILGQAGARGLRAGIVATAGVCAGCSVHIAAATLGVSALLATSATAFTVLKGLGAAYLIWLGLRLLWPRRAARPSDEEADVPARDGQGLPRPPPIGTPVGTPTDILVDTAPPRDLPGIFATGFLTNALNPKVALFFLAFLPQFIAPQASGKSLAMLALGLLFVLNSFLVNVALAWLVTAFARRLGPRCRPGKWLQRLTGGLFIYFGLRLLDSRA